MIPVFGAVSEQKLPPVRTHSRMHKQGKLLAMATMTTTQQLPLSIQLKDRLGKPAQPDGVPEWLSDNSDLVSLEPSADGMSCMAKAVGIIGTVNVTVNADGRSGPDVFAIVGTLQIDITQADAVTVELTAGTAEEQP